MEADAIARQVSLGLTALVPSDNPVFLRSVSATGNDPLLGIRGTEMVVDIEVTPRPAVADVSMREVALSNGRLVEGDLRLFAAASPILTEGMIMVCGGIEYRAVSVDPTRIGGRVVAQTVTLRKRVRGD